VTDAPGIVGRRRALLAGRVLLLVGGAAAIVLIVASRVGEGFSVVGLASGVLRSGFVVALIALAWWAPGLTGWILVILAALLLSLNSTSPVMLVIAAPPLLAGVLLIWGSRPAKAALR
jgi:hypothetical protein